MDFLYAVLGSYVVTAVITLSELCSGPRETFRDIAYRIPSARKLFVDFDFITCRFCVGFYVSVAVTVLFGLSIKETLPVWGASYFMAMIERD